MVYPKFICLLGLLVFNPLAATPLPEQVIRVEIENEGESIADGFAEAFTRLPSGPKYIVIQTDEGPRVLPGSVGSVEAVAAVLVVQVDNGPSYIIPAQDVVRITNAKPSENNL